MFVGRAEKPKSKMILGGRFAYSQNSQNLPRAFQITVLRGNPCVYEGPSDLWCVCMSVSLYVSLWVCVVSSPSLPLCEQRERGSLTGERSSGSDGGDRQWQNVQRGEEGGREGGRVRQRVTGPDKYPHTQTTTTRDKRSEQWQQEKQVGKAGSTVTAAASARQTGRSTGVNGSL